MTGIILINKSGIGFTGRVDDLTITQNTKTSVIPLPGTNNDVVQKMGSSNKQFSLKGYVCIYDQLTGSGETSVDFLNQALNFTGSIYFYSNVLKQTLIPATTIFYQDLQWEDKGSRPLERTFSLSLVELK